MFIVSAIKHLFDKLYFCIKCSKLDDEEVFFMVEWMAIRVSDGYMTAMQGKQTKNRPLVPRRIRKQVIIVLKQMGYDADGELLVKYVDPDEEDDNKVEVRA